MLQFLLPALAGVSSLLGGGSSKQSTAPTMDPAYSPLQSQLLRMITQRLNGGGLPPGYETGAIRNINNTANQGQSSLANMMAARGLSRSPIAANALAHGDLARTGQISTMQSQLPLLERELQTQDLGLAGNLLQFGRGSQSTSSGPSGGAAGFSGLTDMLAFLYGKNPTMFGVGA